MKKSRKSGSKDSSYEGIFLEWLKVAKSNGFVSSYSCACPTFVTHDAIKRFVCGKNGKPTLRSLTKKKVYTPDFHVSFTDKFFDTFPGVFSFGLYRDYPELYVDVKSVYCGKSNSSNRDFSFNQNLMLDRYGLYVARIRMDGVRSLFYYTFAPAHIALQKTNKNKLYSGFKNAKTVYDFKGELKQFSQKKAVLRKR